LLYWETRTEKHAVRVKRLKQFKSQNPTMNIKKQQKSSGYKILQHAISERLPDTKLFQNVISELDEM
ncbi:hypothetical protein, partial [Salmonella sp. s54395]|uniref:hypothetical protein n=1 Tax=Salmonella sp. s54395 TaxID=3159664 RepID=UPI00397F8D6D